MIEEESQDKIYIIECSDWCFTQKASSFQDAALKALSTQLLLIGKNLNLSFILSVKEQSNIENQIFFSTAGLLMDLGFFKLSSDLATLSDFVLDKGQNPLNISSAAKKY